MGFQVYDYREDIRNILITPQIRARFMRMEVGEASGSLEAGPGHSHDLGHEVFIVLQGQIEFEIGNDVQVLGPGQMCVAMTDEPHRTRNVGSEPAIMYLSVTPHIQPTHTGWTREGSRAPARFVTSTSYDVPQDHVTPSGELAQHYLDAVETLSEMVRDAASVQRERGASLQRALNEKDRETMVEAREAMWEVLCPMFRQVYVLADAWNNLTYRTADETFWSG